ncbi:hypothetical protein D9M08_09670 [Escherichia albertii]|uniref:Uncharacterized protein n=1 Tax=Escherichia albertii TaxID=208962 RepID=A0A7U8T7M8_ESCAL|nr:hypothetical protein [Escherichia albertii]EEW7550086.1 hypothetical protein [Escherichia albertii]EFF0784067.1 hypothetical protein [Escherichia albertii]EFO0320707.1 hypothetical protein [Escherichia albertii]EGE0303180.1 hypothetical protein [Escherichia albertii]
MRKRTETTSRQSLRGAGFRNLALVESPHRRLLLILMDRLYLLYGKNHIIPDVDSHNVTNGWKIFDRKGNRTGTYDDKLNRIKD